MSGGGGSQNSQANFNEANAFRFNPVKDGHDEKWGGALTVMCDKDSLFPDLSRTKQQQPAAESEGQTFKVSILQIVR